MAKMLTQKDLDKAYDNYLLHQLKRDLGLDAEYNEKMDQISQEIYNFTGVSYEIDEKGDIHARL